MYVRINETRDQNGVVKINLLFSATASCGPTLTMMPSTMATSQWSQTLW